MKIYRLFFKETFNNLFCMVCDDKGNEFFWTSCGLAGFKGPARSTPFACENAGLLLSKKLKQKGISKCTLYLYGKFSRKIKEALKSLKDEKIIITRIIVMPRLSHNGGRLAKKKRR
jgi:small subunit ribosomal protein S11